MESWYKPGINVGILGGGQLGMMLCQAAIDLNINLFVLDPDPNCSCHNLAAGHTIGHFKDEDAVLAFGQSLDVVTVEIESVSTAGLRKLQAQGIKVFPYPEHLDLIRDKQKQKQFYQDHHIPTAPFRLTKNKTGLTEALEAFAFPVIYKSATDGYDGRGVMKIYSAQDVEHAFAGPGIVEALIPFVKEFSIIISRNFSGETAYYDPVEQVFHPEQNILQYLIAPAEIPASASQAAVAIAQTIVNQLAYVGILAIEFFLLADGSILVNEMAPRPHNSGHHTIRANATSQFEQHLRAILNLPPGSTEALAVGAMANILGDEDYTGSPRYTGLVEGMALGGVYPFLYGKEVSKPFRKMGHVTIIGQTKEEVIRKINLLNIKTS